MVSIPGDGEKCKRVNLRCGEKAFGLRSRETNQGIERKGKRSRELRGEEGAKGETAIGTSAQGSRAELDFSLIRSHLQRVKPLGSFRVVFSFRVFLFLPFFIFAIPDCSVCRPMVSILGQNTMRPKISFFRGEDPCLFPLPDHQESID